MKSEEFKPAKYFQLNAKAAMLFSLLLFIYLVLRAYFVPFLHDEIMTYWFYINPGRYFPFLYKINVDAANNHVLNSFLTQLFYKLFGFEPFVLRMANLMFIPLYCYFAYKIAHQLKNKYLAMLFFLCLLFVHSIVEFMALSRGYGMSFALMLAALWFFIKFLKSVNPKNIFFSLGFLQLSIAANLSLMNSCIIITALMLINIFITTDKLSKKILNTFVVLLTGILPLLFFIKYSFALQRGGALYYGTHDGFWSQSVTTLITALFQNKLAIIRPLVFIYFVLIVFIMFRFVAKRLNFKIFRQSSMLFPLLLIGNIIAVLLLDYFFNVNFPEDRSGFYFYYFFIASLFFLIDKLAEEYNYRKTVFILLPLVLIPLHFAMASNFTHIAVYKEDRVPYRFYNKIKEKSENMAEVASLGSYFGRTLVLAYQNYINKANVGKSHDSDYPSLIPDFQVVKTEDFPIWNLYYNSIDYDKVSGYRLLERKEKLCRKLIFEKQQISSKGKISDEYFNLSEGNIDTLIDKPLFFEYDMDIESETAPFEAWVVVSVSDSAGNTKAYEYIPLNWIKPKWDNENKHFHNGQLVCNLPATSQKYVTYIWNINKVSYSISNAKLSVKQLYE